MPYLHLNVQNANPLPLCNVLHCLNARPVVVAPELRMLDKPVRRYQPQELVFGRVVVFAAVLLAGAGCARGICVRAWLVSPGDTVLVGYAGGRAYG